MPISILHFVPPSWRSSTFTNTSPRALTPQISSWIVRILSRAVSMYSQSVMKMRSPSTTPLAGLRPSRHAGTFLSLRGRYRRNVITSRLFSNLRKGEGHANFCLVSEERKAKIYKMLGTYGPSIGSTFGKAIGNLRTLLKRFRFGAAHVDISLIPKKDKVSATVLPHQPPPMWKLFMRFIYDKRKILRETILRRYCNVGRTRWNKARSF